MATDPSPEFWDKEVKPPDTTGVPQPGNFTTLWKVEWRDLTIACDPPRQRLLWSDFEPEVTFSVPLDPAQALLLVTAVLCRKGQQLPDYVEAAEHAQGFEAGATGQERDWGRGEFWARGYLKGKALYRMKRQK